MVYFSSPLPVTREGERRKSGYCEVGLFSLYTDCPGWGGPGAPKRGIYTEKYFFISPSIDNVY
jgi:hypothetical protein